MGPDIDKILADTATRILTEVFKGTLEASISGWKWFKKESEARDFFGTAAKKYAKSFIKRYNRIKIIGQTESIPLTDIYVHVNVLEKITSWQRFTFEEIEAWEKEYRKRGSFGQIEENAVDGLELVKKKPHLMLLGQPGGGKTTFLKYIGIQTLQGKLNKKLIPVFVSLKELADSGYKIEKYLYLEFDICNFRQAELFVDRQLREGNLYLLLDGLDEVGKNKVNDLYKEIYDFCNKYDQNRYILSCRTAAYNQNFMQFTDVELANFDKRQIVNYIKNWFHNNAKKRDSCIKKLHLEENKPILELAKTPLLLALLCLAYDETMDFPTNRSELYEDAIRALLIKWDITRNIKRDEIYRNLTPRRKIEMFSKIACETFQNEKNFFRQKEVEEKVASFIENIPGVNTDSLDVDSSVVLKAIEAQHGILVERIHNVYSFSHLTFQEYFTARYIKDNTDTGTLQRLIVHLLDRRWREVFLIMAGMLTQADNLIQLMKEKANALIQDDDLMKLISLARNKAVSVKTKGLPYETRFFYLNLYLDPASAYNVFHAAYRVVDLCSDLVLAFGLDYALASALDIALASKVSLAHTSTINIIFDNALRIAKELRIKSLTKSLIKLKSQLSSNEASSKEWLAWAERLRKVMIRERNIGYKIELNKNQTSCLKDYLYANQLIKDCLNCGSYVSKNVREDFFDKLFIPPNL